MKYMLDTNICIFAMKKKSDNIIRNIITHDPDELCISSITYAELVHGVEKSQAVDKNRMALTLFLSNISIIPFGDKAAEMYGEVRAKLESKGTPIGPMDMLIAAHAKSMECIMVTNNMREFQRVEGLALEDWL